VKAFSQRGSDYVSYAFASARIDAGFDQFVNYLDASYWETNCKCN